MTFSRTCHFVTVCNIVVRLGKRFVHPLSSGLEDVYIVHIRIYAHKRAGLTVPKKRRIRIPFLQTNSQFHLSGAEHDRVTAAFGRAVVTIHPIGVVHRSLPDLLTRINGKLSECISLEK